MVDSDDGAPLESRPPTLEDLVALCRRLNEEHARYIVVGGMAIIQAGFVRATEGVDLLIDASADNVVRVKRALLALPDGAAADVEEDDVKNYDLVRVADEIVVDLMKAACGIEYTEARHEVELVDIDGVPIPFAAPALLWRMKETTREKDRFLQLSRPFAVMGERCFRTRSQLPRQHRGRPFEQQGHSPGAYAAQLATGLPAPPRLRTRRPLRRVPVATEVPRPCRPRSLLPPAPPPRSAGSGSNRVQLSLDSSEHGCRTADRLR